MRACVLPCDMTSHEHSWIRVRRVRSYTRMTGQDDREGERECERGPRDKGPKTGGGVGACLAPSSFPQ